MHIHSAFFPIHLYAVVVVRFFASPSSHLVHNILQLVVFVISTLLISNQFEVCQKHMLIMLLAQFLHFIVVVVMALFVTGSMKYIFMCQLFN